MPTYRHQCLTYHGAESSHLLALVGVIRRKLRENCCCLYLNSEPMIERLKSYLAAGEIDVTSEIQRGSLILSSERKHLDESGSFDVQRMIQGLSDALDRALSVGYYGLLASGDMAWEFGPEKDFSKLLEYEWRLEELFGQRAELSAICQYHADTLPREATLRGLLLHSALFVNETTSINNPYYRPPEVFTEERGMNPEAESVLDWIYQRIAPD